MTDRPLIGIDFDNTIASYDHVFASAAAELALLPNGFTGSKTAVREAIRRTEAGEVGWMRLQGQVYGRLMHRARPCDGVLEFLARCRAVGLPVLVISHKTEFGHYDPHRVNLREAALTWMEKIGLLDEAKTGLSRNRVHFEATRAEKVRRIARAGCTHFIDDLPEVFAEPDFPSVVGRYLYDPDERCPEGPYTITHSWLEIADDLLGRV